MKINRKENLIMFKNLSYGDVFGIDDEVYMKTSTINTDRVMTNCVNLKTGEHCNMKPEGDVCKIECVLEEK